MTDKSLNNNESQLAACNLTPDYYVSPRLAINDGLREIQFITCEVMQGKKGIPIRKR